MNDKLVRGGNLISIAVLIAVIIILIFILESGAAEAQGGDSCQFTLVLDMDFDGETLRTGDVQGATTWVECHYEIVCHGAAESIEDDLAQVLTDSVGGDAMTCYEGPNELSDYELFMTTEAEWIEATATEAAQQTQWAAEDAAVEQEIAETAAYWSTQEAVELATEAAQQTQWAVEAEATEQYWRDYDATAKAERANWLATYDAQRATR